MRCSATGNQEAPPPKPLTKTRVNNLIQCPDCGKYLAKKTLNYSHKRTCPALPENQNKPKVEKKEVKLDPVPEVYQEPVYEPPPQPQIPYYERMRLERKQMHNERIRHLSQFIA